MKRKHLLAAFLFLLGGLPALAKAPSPKPLKAIQNKACAFSLRLPKGSEWKEIGDCTYQLTLPPFKGQPWVESAVLNLEVSKVVDGDAEKAVDEDGQAVMGKLVTSQLEWEKATEEDCGKGHCLVTVSYTAMTVSHQYHFACVMNTGDPSDYNKKIKTWDPSKAAEKVFDGVLMGFRSLDL